MQIDVKQLKVPALTFPSQLKQDLINIFIKTQEQRRLLQLHTAASKEKNICYKLAL